MKIRRRFKGRKIKDNKGYLSSNKEQATPYKRIEGGDITMEGVDIPLIAVPLDENGNPMDMKFMNPGEEHNFPGAKETIEVPVAGGRRKRKLQTGGNVNEANSLDFNSLLPVGFRSGNDAELFGVKSNLDFTKGTDFSNKTFLDIDRSNLNLPTNEELDLDELEGQTADLDAFTKQLAKEQEEANKQEADTFDNIIQSEVDKDLNTTEQDLSTVDTNPITQRQNEGFFNPYAGIDIPTAANIFGENIGKGGDAKTAVASGAKLLLGLGRNITSGIGRANRNAFQLKDLNEKRRESLISEPTALGQEGGEFSEKELKEIKDSTGIEFTSEGASQIFEKVQPFKKPPKQEIDLGKFKEVGYFDVSMNGQKFVVKPSAKNFRNAKNFKEDLRYLQRLNPNIEFDGAEDLRHFVSNDKRRPENFEEGGDIDAMELTGNAASGVDEGAVNVELEVNEYYKAPDGMPIKVLGDTHEQGGEEMNLEDGTQVISDHLKLTKAQAKEVAKDYDIKVSTKDTYAKALDKFNKKSGLQALIEEEAEVIEEIKKQKEAAAEKGADEATINVNLEFLSSKLKDITDSKAPLEELSSNAFDRIFKLQEDSKPKEDNDSEDSFELGGVVYPKDQILSIAKRFGVDDDKAVSIIKEMQQGGSVNDRRKDFINQVKSLGYDGDVNEENFESNIGEIQKYLANKKPQAIVDYFTKSGVAITAKGVDKIKQDNPDIFEELGFDIKKGSASFTEAERKALQNKLIEGDKVGDDFWLDQFQDGRWEYRFPQIPLETPKVDGIQEIEIPGIEIDLGDLQQRTTTTETEEFEDFEDDKKTGDEKRARTNALLLPENMPLPPQGLQMPLKVTRRYDRLDRVALSPDARLAELNRGVDAAMAKLDKLPSGQKEAAILQLQANKQAQADKIVAETEQRENQTNFNVDTFNVRQNDREEDARAIDALDFERRAFGALANTEDDFRRFFNTVQERNIQNFRTINDINLINQTSDNFNFGNDGVEFTGGADMDAEDLLNASKHRRAVRISNSSTATTTKKKKKRGGRVKRKY